MQISNPRKYGSATRSSPNASNGTRSTTLLGKMNNRRGGRDWIKLFWIVTPSSRPVDWWRYPRNERIASCVQLSAAISYEFYSWSPLLLLMPPQLYLKQNTVSQVPYTESVRTKSPKMKAIMDLDRNGGVREIVSGLCGATDLQPHKVVSWRLCKFLTSEDLFCLSNQNFTTTQGFWNSRSGAVRSRCAAPITVVQNPVDLLQALNVEPLSNSGSV